MLSGREHLHPEKHLLTHLALHSPEVLELQAEPPLQSTVLVLNPSAPLTLAGHSCSPSSLLITIELASLSIPPGR